MPGIWMKQPNGHYARFSTVVDDFTHLNCTRTEAFEVCRYDMGVFEAEQALVRADRDECEAKHCGRDDGLGRWNEALETLRVLGKSGVALKTIEIDEKQEPLKEVEEPPLALGTVVVMRSEPTTQLCLMDGTGLAVVYGRDRAERERIADWIASRVNGVKVLREALTQVKVDHLNRKVKLPVKTHALVENALADTDRKEKE